MAICPICRQQFRVAPPPRLPPPLPPPLPSEVAGAPREAGPECPACHHRVKAGAPRCVYCGANLPQAAEETASASLPEHPPAKCPACHRRVGTHATRCLYCGATW